MADHSLEELKEKLGLVRVVKHGKVYQMTEAEYEKERRLVDNDDSQVKLYSEDLDLETDYQYARDNIRKLIDENREMIDYLKNIVKESDDPAHIREFTKLLVSIQEMNADLVKMTIETKKELNKKYATSKRPENEEPNAKINNQQNNFFTGTTKDILEAMKSGKIKDITPDEQ